jgi:hypothetical protein
MKREMLKHSKHLLGEGSQGKAYKIFIPGL